MSIKSALRSGNSIAIWNGTDRQYSQRLRACHKCPEPYFSETNCQYLENEEKNIKKVVKLQNVIDNRANLLYYSILHNHGEICL